MLEIQTSLEVLIKFWWQYQHDVWVCLIKTTLLLITFKLFIPLKYQNMIFQGRDDAQYDN